MDRSDAPLRSPCAFASRGMLLAALVLVFVRPAAADEGQPTPEGWVRHAAAGERVGLSVPADWRAAPEPQRASEDVPLVLRVRPPGAEDACLLYVSHRPGMAEPPQQVQEQKPYEWKQEGVRAVWSHAAPRPHLTVDLERDGRALVAGHAFRIVEGRGFSLTLEVPKESWDALRDDFLRCVDTLTTTLGPYPGMPEGYERSERDGLVWYVHPRVARADIEGYQDLVREVGRAFRRRHGPFPRHSSGEFSVQYTTDWVSASALGDAPGEVRAGHGVSVRRRRLFASPFDPTVDATGPCDARASIWALFLRRRYGGAHPRWMHQAEADLQFMEAAAGGPLPRATAFLLEQPNPPDRPFSIADDREDGDDPDAFRRRRALYVALLIAGPARYRKAYERFLEELAQGADGSEAAARHLLSLDPARMQADAGALLAKCAKASRR